MAIHVTSPVFPSGGTIPQKYSCDGENVSPPLEWHGSPDGTQSFALVCDDPDAPNGPFTHWILYDIPPSKTTLREGEAKAGVTGVNSFGETEYGGPCPPHGGPPHHYAFHIYALDVPSIGTAGLNKREIVNAMERHVIGEGELVAEYSRKRQ